MGLHMLRLGGLLTWVAIAASLSGCLVEPADQKIWNRSGETVQVFTVRDGEENLRIAALEPDRFYPLNYGGDCPELDLVARTTTGAEVERRTGPFCEADEWIIDGSNEHTSAPMPSPELTPTPMPT